MRLQEVVLTEYVDFGVEDVLFAMNDCSRSVGIVTGISL